MPEGESLLVNNKVSIQIRDGEKSKDKRITSKNIAGLVIQDPNTRFLGMRIKLAVFSMNKDTVNNKWNKKLRELGEPPVVFDSLTLFRSGIKIEKYLNNKGYFEPLVDISVEKLGKKKRKIRVRYKVSLNDVYTFRSSKVQIDDDNLAPLILDFPEKSLIKYGQPYDVDLLNKERERITEKFRNNGYFAFNREYISYTIDSALKSREMDITTTIRNVQSSEVDSTGERLEIPHKKYYIDNVYFVPQTRTQTSNSIVLDTIRYTETLGSGKKKREGPEYYLLYQGAKPIVKPSALAQKTFLAKGELFRIDNVKNSYENLTDLKVFSYTDVSVTEKAYDSTKSYAENNKLDCRLTLVQGKKFGFSTEAELTASAGFMPGIAANITFQDRNLFRGGEVLNVKLRGMYELQSSFDNNRNKSFLNTFEIKGEVSLDFPRLLAPISLERLSKYYRSKSTVSLSYSYQNKVDYSRGIFLATWGYSWKRGKISQTFNPIEINTVKMLKTSSQFESELDKFSQSNLRLKYQYEDHFILDWAYNFIYNDQKTGSNVGFNHFRLGVETAGNLLYGIAVAAGAHKNETGQYQIFNLAFSQYARMEADYKHHFVFGKDVALVFRTMLGIGFSYANSKTLPYEKSFYAGGSNSLRAWPLYQVGPGSYTNEGNSNLERLGDIVWVVNLEQRFPIVAGLKGAVFLDAGNIWLMKKNSEFEGGEFKFNKFYKDMTLGTGIGLRYDFGFFLIRVDMGIPLHDPAKAASNRWVVKDLKGKDLLFNFGIGYPF